MGRPASEIRSTLRAHSDFQRIYSSKLRLFRDGLTFYYYKAEDLVFRFAVSIPKRFGKAVERNTIRRRIKAIVKNVDSIPDNTEIIFCVNSPCKELSYEKLLCACEWVFDKINRIKTPKRML